MLNAESFCRLNKSIKVLSRKWSLVVICHLLTGRKRFSELEKLLRGISPKVLTETLSFLEKEGIVERIVVKGKPISVFYGLTNKGKSLEKVIHDLIEWEQNYPE